MSNVVILKGTPYEQGFTEGQQLKDIIISNVEEVKEKLNTSNVDWLRYNEFVARNAEYMKKDHPDLVEEMKGISDGSGVSFEDILTINIPAYFMLDYFNQECSMIIARGKATADGCTYVIKNRDMSTYIEQAVIQREYSNGLKIVEVNGAGTVTYPASGMNSYGLGVSTTGFWSKKAPSDLSLVDSTQIFLNVHLLLKNCKTAKEALEYVKNTKRMNGLNVIIVDREDAYIVEMTKDDVYVQEDDGSGLLWRTNHYISHKFSWMNPDPTEYTSTYKRFERIGEMLKEKCGKIRFQDIWRIVSDHENGINSICRHPKGEVKAKTVSSSMFVLEDFEAWTAIGYPCEALKYSSLK